MGNIIKLELKKAFFNKWFYLSIGLLLFFAIFSAGYMIESRRNYNPLEIEAYCMEDGKFVRNPDLEMFGLYHSWIGGEELSLASSLFYALLPVGAALPFAWSFHIERKTGYLRNVFTRVYKRNYFCAKIIAVFLSGAVVVLVPLITNLMLVSAYIPTENLFVGYIYYNHLLFGSMWVDILYTNPLLHTILYVGMSTLYGGIFALLSFSLSFFIKNLFTVIFLPFLMMVVANYLQHIAYESFNLTFRPDFVPTNFLHSRTNTQGIGVAVITILLIVSTIVIIYAKGKRDEVL